MSYLENHSVSGSFNESKNKNTSTSRNSIMVNDNFELENGTIEATIDLETA